MLRVMGLLNKNVKAVIPQCGKVTKFDNAKVCLDKVKFQMTKKLIQHKDHSVFFKVDEKVTIRNRHILP